MSRALFCMSFLDSLLCKCLAHCVVCVLLTNVHVGASCTIFLCVLLTVFYVIVLRTVFNVFGMIFLLR